MTSSSSTGNSRANNWALDPSIPNLTGTLDTGKYFEFSLTAATGITFSGLNVQFGLGRSGTGPRQWQWRSSADNFAAPIAMTTVNAGITHAGGVITVPDNTTGYTGNDFSFTQTGLSTITFRIYGYNAEATGGTGGLQGNLVISGTLSGGGRFLYYQPQSLHFAV